MEGLHAVSRLVVDVLRFLEAGEDGLVGVAEGMVMGARHGC